MQYGSQKMNYNVRDIGKPILSFPLLEKQLVVFSVSKTRTNNFPHQTVRNLTFKPINARLKNTSFARQYMFYVRLSCLLNDKGYFSVASAHIVASDRNIQMSLEKK